MIPAVVFIKVQNWEERKYQSTGEWINKEILFSDKKKKSTDSLNNMDKPQNHHAEKTS